MIKLNTIIAQFPGGMHYIPIPQETALQAIKQYGKRVKCQINTQSFHCALMTKKEIGYYIYLGKKLRKQLHVSTGDEVAILISEDNSPYQANMSEELQEVLLTDEEAQYFFDQLTDGKKRSIIHLVSSAKKSETRIRRALKIMDNLKIGITNPKEFLK